MLRLNSRPPCLRPARYLTAFIHLEAAASTDRLSDRLARITNYEGPR